MPVRLALGTAATVSPPGEPVNGLGAWSHLDRHDSNPGRARRRADIHKDTALTREELVRVTDWVDTNCQYYGAYWGRRALAHRDHPNFRPVPTFETAVSMSSPVPEDGR